MTGGGSEPAAEQTFDLIVIGAGTNGAAIAREAALLGLGVLIIEAEDVGGATTAASTRLIHGGLRYLEHAEISLVYESLSERERLLHAAPHLVTPLEFLIPIYKKARRSRWQIRAGMLLYDLLSWRKSLPGHSMLDRDRVLERLPGIEPAGLVGAASYYDAQVRFPERLTLENVLDAMDHGARLLTHSAVDEILVEQGQVRGVGWRGANGEPCRALSPIVVNAAGPWVDRVNGDSVQEKLIGGTRGSHLIAEPFEGAPSTAVYIEAHSDGRPFFVLPWNGLYLIGTTDERFDGDPASVEVTEPEVDYLLKETARAFPGARALASRVAYTYAGIRPLPRRARDGSGNEGSITRRHRIHRHRDVHGLYSIVGGKLTTHRELAVDTLKILRRRHTGLPEGSKTASRGLPGALAGQDRQTLLSELTQRLGQDDATRWWRIYGGMSRKLMERIESDPSLADPVLEGRPLRIVELVHSIESERALTLEDILQRRCMAGLDADFGLGLAGPAADCLVRLGIWDREFAADEIDRYKKFAGRHRPRIPAPAM